MALENAVVLKNLKEQRTTIETQINDGQEQLEQLKATYLRLSGAIEILQQIEDTNNPPPPQEDEVSPEEGDGSESKDFG